MTRLGTVSAAWEEPLWGISWVKSLKDMPRSPSHREATITKATKVTMPEPISHTKGGRPRLWGIFKSRGGMRRMASVWSTSLTKVGAAESSVLKRSKLAVRLSGRTCKALAVTAKGGKEWSTSLEIISRWSFMRRVATKGAWPVMAYSKVAAKP